VKSRRGKTLIVALYVDYIIFMGNSSIIMEEFKRAMMKKFEMIDLGLIKYFLGLEVKQHEKDIFVSQEAYAKEILKRFGMENCNPIAISMELGTKFLRYDEGEEVDANLYRSLIRSLRYLTCTRPDIMFVVGVASRYMERPMTSHWKAAKRILRYVRGTVDLGLHYSKTNSFKLVGYSDSDWCGDIDDTKSTLEFTFYVGDTVFTWLSKKQAIVTLSTCEAEYVAASLCVNHAIWLRNLLYDLKLPQLEATEIRVDNKSAIELAKNPVHHERSKHIDVRYHSIREHIKEKEVQVTHVPSNDQVADIFTKALPRPLFENCRRKLGMMNTRDLRLKEDVEYGNP
jgi:Reverse transcriptase (RNA-dependent DNA polymerase)